MNSKKLNITQPADWLDAFRAQAAKEGKTVGQWMGDVCRAKLPPAIRKTLSERPPAHRPKRENGD